MVAYRRHGRFPPKRRGRRVRSQINPRRTVMVPICRVPMVLTAVIAVFLAGDQLRAESPRPNILLVHCHDLGQFLHCYGVKTVQTPNLDRLGEAVRREGQRP